MPTEADRMKTAAGLFGCVDVDGKMTQVSGVEDIKIALDANTAVHHPRHYNTGNIEVWDAIIAWDLDFILGNVVKYVARAGHKGDKLEDLLKAQAYIDKAIEAYAHE